MKYTYIIGHITVKNREKWEEYRSRVPATLEPFGAELVFRGTLQSILSGTHSHTDTVVIRFPDSKAVEKWYGSPEYQALVPLRQEAADVDLLSFTE